MLKIRKIVEIRTQSVWNTRRDIELLKKGTRKQENKQTYWYQVNLYGLESKATDVICSYFVVQWNSDVQWIICGTMYAIRTYAFVLLRIYAHTFIIAYSVSFLCVFFFLILSTHLSTYPHTHTHTVFGM